MALAPFDNHCDCGVSANLKRVWIWKKYNLNLPKDTSEAYIELAYFVYELVNFRHETFDAFRLGLVLQEPSVDWGYVQKVVI